MEGRLPIFQWSRRSDGQTLRLRVDLSFGEAARRRTPYPDERAQRDLPLAAEGAITPDDEDHAMLKAGRSPPPQQRRPDMNPEMKEAFGFSRAMSSRCWSRRVAWMPTTTNSPSRSALSRSLIASSAWRIHKGSPSPSPSKGRSSTCSTRETVCRPRHSTSGS